MDPLLIQGTTNFLVPHNEKLKIFFLYSFPSLPTLNSTDVINVVW